jgi:hypothetical protein
MLRLTLFLFQILLFARSPHSTSAGILCSRSLLAPTLNTMRLTL